MIQAKNLPMSFLHFDLTSFIQTAGYIGIFAFVFAESGLFFGFFLPGDSLLFTAGFLASQGYLNIWILAVGVWIFAVLGDNVGYWFGKRVGPALFSRPESRFFKPDHLMKAQKFYEKNGKKTIILARFIPIVRTFAPIVAGAGQMHYRTFFAYNIIGGFLWGACLPIVGYFLGSAIPNFDRYLLPIIALIIIISVLPIIIEFAKARKS